MILRLLFSRTARHANALRKHVEKLVNHQRDILAPADLQELESAMKHVRDAIVSGADRDALSKQMENLEQVANKRLKQYPDAGLRENIEVLLVALAVAMGVRTFFLQPFKIPTGSMQPTLYGITSIPDFKNTIELPDNLGPNPDFAIPGFVHRFLSFWSHGISYVHVVAKSDGLLTAAERPVRFLIFTLWQRFQVGGVWYRVWFPPDDMLERAALFHFNRPNPKVFKTGQDIIKMKIFAGDHLFVDRLTYNFRAPKRGEIIVFETRGIAPETLPQDQFYIKRLVALPNEHVQIGDDRHLIIDGKRLDKDTPHFQNVYSFDPSQPPQDSHYSGHVNQRICEDNLPPGRSPPMPLFRDQSSTYDVLPDHYMVMGDNTMNSLDSRYWGDFPVRNVIGRAFFVYWPVTDRFAFGCLRN
jgi:signal peptidase I